jgi:hypothetical protein
MFNAITLAVGLYILQSASACHGSSNVKAEKNACLYFVKHPWCDLLELVLYPKPTCYLMC